MWKKGKGGNPLGETNGLWAETIGDGSGTYGSTWRQPRGVQDFINSVFGVSVSQGALQKIINRAQEAITPHY